MVSPAYSEVVEYSLDKIGRRTAGRLHLRKPGDVSIQWSWIYCSLVVSGVQLLSGFDLKVQSFPENTLHFMTLNGEQENETAKYRDVAWLNALPQINCF